MQRKEKPLSRRCDVLNFGVNVVWALEEGVEGEGSEARLQPDDKAVIYPGAGRGESATRNKRVILC